MAEAIGIEVGKLFVEKLGFKAGKLIMSVKDINSQIQRLQETKSIIEATLRDADPLESCSSVEGKMIRNLHGIEARLEYFFDEKQTRAKQKELMGGSRHSKELRLFFSSSNQLVSPLRTAAKIKEIKEELESIARDHSLVSGIANNYSMSRRKQTEVLAETGPFLATDVVIGRNEDRDSIITELFHSTNDQESFSPVAIVGIGGQGKTTLAQYVYNDERVKSGFDVQLWVFATLDFSVSKVLQKIIASANTDEKTFKGEMVQLQHRMVQAIVGKKFLLVIDNVWEGPNLVENWEQVKALLKVGAKGSKVLITTRSETVARNMGTFDPYMLCDLGKDESWRLFKHFAFKQGQESGIEAIGKEIADMIPRVPLVIKVIGCHLADKGTIREWEAFKNELASNSSSHVRDKIMQTLKISYDRLDKKLKLCVAYCSLFPKGTRFDVDKMVRIWIALGYVESESGKLEDIGEEYVNQLGRCGFFQVVCRNKYGQLIWFYMHDVMHDLLLSIDKSVYQMIDYRTSKIAEGVSHVSFCRANDLNWDVPSSVLIIKQQLQSILIVEADDIVMKQYGELQTLDWFVVGEDTSESKGSVAGGLTELSDLNNLKGELTILVNRESKYIAAEAKTAHLKMKKQLTELIIDFEKSGKEDYMVLEALQPHGDNLKFLCIENYGGEKLPDWIDTLNSLKALTIWGCPRLGSLPH
ncbi:hypothetical protein BVRB_3g051360 [Beta vulgaris subsp. vulgaris]|nr:hypothetical protein BVRB_3g051360 [Beta vulgaris subsp. vulgaris]